MVDYIYDLERTNAVTIIEIICLWETAIVISLLLIAMDGTFLLRYT